ncbi:MAG: T9SS type A sorting domain-containing protein [Fibrobacter sp.]|nr:T9SS type A sorting domain-containing protein [Fibrobacter sp.]
MNLKKMALAACAASAVYAAPDPNFHIYLAFGQSNMEGQGNIESQDKTVDSRFQVLWTTNETNCGKKLGQWSDAVPPLASCSSKLGPADYFGRTMVEKTDSQIRVGIVDVAVAGCSIQLFESPLSQSYMNQQASWFKQRVEAYGGKPYERLIEMAKKAQEDGVIKGIIFHQGETDAGDNQWPSKVKAVYDRIISDLGLGNDIPFLAGEVLRSGMSSGANNNIAKLPQQSKNFYVISSEGFNQALSDGQNVHFTSQEYRDFGKRYAEKMIEVLGDKIKPVASAVESSSSEAVVESSSSEAVVESSSSSRHHGWPSYSSSYIGTIDPTAIDVPHSQSRLVGKAVVNAGRVTVPVALECRNVNAKVFSMQGTMVLDFSDSFAGGSLGFDASRLPSGNYMLSVQVGSERSVQKVQIK